MLEDVCCFSLGCFELGCVCFAVFCCVCWFGRVWRWACLVVDIFGFRRCLVLVCFGVGLFCFWLFGTVCVDYGLVLSWALSVFVWFVFWCCAVLGLGVLVLGLCGVVVFVCCCVGSVCI